MALKVNKVAYKGTIQNRSDSQKLLSNPGDFVIVKRKVARLLILRCPCGCGDDLLINLDKRAGSAWRLYSKYKSYSLYPSYWRDTACRSHFIIWKNRIFWFHGKDEYDDDWNVSTEVEEKVLAGLKECEFTNYLELADECGLIPWECLKACIQLSEKGLCKSNEGLPREYFKKTPFKHD